jgi:transmembrane sensor
MTGGTRRQASVADAAAEWFATLSDAQCTSEEREQFADWLRRSNLHVEEFLRISVFARQLGEPSLWSRESVEQLVAQALEAQNNVSTLDAARKSPLRLSKPLRWAIPVAAAACLAAVMTFVVNPAWFSAPGTIYTTAVGEQRSIALEDGSVVELNTQSSLRTRFTESERAVDLLRGEAIFRVAKNPHRPFRVFSGSTEIMAVGTAFNVYARDSGTVVTVIEGRVRVTSKDISDTGAAPSSDMELTRGEQAVIMPRQPIVRVALTDPNKATAWTERRLIFEDMPLSAVTAEFARYYNARTIRIADPGIADLHITGVFDASDPASLVQFLGAFGGIEIREDERGWTLLGSRTRTPAAEVVAK